MGARAINDHLPEALSLLTPMEQPKVLHQVGRNDLHEVQARYEQLGVSAEVVEFIDDMAAAYARSGLLWYVVPAL